MLLPTLRKKYTLHRLEQLLQQRSLPSYEPIPQSLLYVAANCLPYHVSGYTTRTHEILVALQHAGIQTHAITRAGYPWDHAPLLAKPAGKSTTFEGITYEHTRYPRRLLSLIRYTRKAAYFIAQHAIQHKVACIHAASNYVNALPALVAARWLNIPFHYEMRGHWELSRTAQKNSYVHSYAYYLGMHLEEFVAHRAQRVFCISHALAHFVHLQVDNNKVYLLPNCIDAERICMQSPQDTIPHHIGYAGSLLSYEGLDILFHALQIVIQKNEHVFLHIIGHGVAKKQLEALALELNVEKHVCFYGKLAPQEARHTLKQCGLICIPRAPVKVCEIVPPIKLIEAMALGKSVIIPDLPVFKEEAAKAPVFFFEAGNATHLAQTLLQALSKPQDLARKGLECRKFALEHRQWKHFIPTLAPKDMPL